MPITPLNIQQKVDSPAKVLALAGVPANQYMTNAETNAHVAKTNELVTKANTVDSAIMGLASGEGGKMYNTLAIAQALNPKPANGIVFQVSEVTDPTRAGYYTFQSTEANGTRYEKPFTTDLTGRVNNINTSVDVMQSLLGITTRRTITGATSGSQTQGTGDLIGFATPLTIRTQVKTITFIPVTIPDAAFTIRLYAVSGASSSVANTVTRVLPSITVSNVVAGVAVTVNVNQIFEVGEYIYLALPTGVKTYYGGGVTGTFGYRPNVANVQNLIVGANVFTMQMLTGMPVKWDILEETNAPVDFNAFATTPQLSAVATRTTAIEEMLKATNIRVITGSVSGSQTQGTGEVIGLRDALTVRTQVKSITFTPVTVPSANFQIRLYAFNGALSAFANNVMRALPLVDVTGAVAGTPITITINQTFEIGEYIYVGLPSGVKTYYNQAGVTTGFAYRASINATGLAVGYGNTMQLLNGMPVGFNLLEVTGVYIDFSALVKRTEITKDVPNSLWGKTLDVMGDSMVKGHSLAIADTWSALIGSRNNMSVNNYGINGNRLTNTGGIGVPLVLRYMDMAAVRSADYIGIFIGTNDAAANVAMGTDDSTDNTTFKGALNIVCDGLQTLCPDKKIFFITPYKRVQSDQVLIKVPVYVTAIETICAKYGIPVFNNITKGGINWANAAQISAFNLNNDSYHLNIPGMVYASAKYEAFMRTL